MFQFFRYPYYGYLPTKYVVNPVRVVEFVLCLICLILAVVIVLTYPLVSAGVKVVLSVTAGAFAIVTFIDMISHSYKNPIYWNTWAMFSLAAALMFFICLGLLIAVAVSQTKPLIIVAAVIFAITAIIFLLDALLLLYLMRKNLHEVCPDVCWCESEVCPRSPFRKPEVKGGKRGKSKPIKKNKNGQYTLDDGTPVKQVKMENGEIGYQDEQGNIYNANGEIIKCKSSPCLPECRAECAAAATRTKSHSKGKKRDAPKSPKHRGSSPQNDDDSPRQGGDSPRSSLKSRDSPRQGSKVSYGSAGKHGKFRDAALPTICSATLPPCADARYKAPAKKCRPCSAPGDDPRRSRCKMYLADGTPLTEVQTCSGTMLYETPHGELFAPDGTPICNTQDVEVNVPSTTSCHPCSSGSVSAPPSPRQLVCRADEPALSRTVSVSTRMVPKPQMRRVPNPGMGLDFQKKDTPCFNTTCPTYMQEPQYYAAQSYASPCGCGSPHYQTVTTVQGSLFNQNQASKGSHGRSRSPSGTGCTGEECSARSESPSAYKRDQLQNFEKTPLHTISESEYEIDQRHVNYPSESASTVASRPTVTTIDPSSQTQSSVSHVKDSGSDAVQTSETRMMRASDIQKIASQDKGK